jgi:hypothetical protein
VAGRAGGVGVEVDLGVVADDVVVAALADLDGLRQVAELPVLDPQDRPRQGGPRLPQHAGHQRSVTDLAVGVGVQGHRQPCAQLQRHGQLGRQHLALDRAQHLQAAGHVLDLLAVQGQHGEGPDTVGQRLTGHGRADGPQALGPLGQQALAQAQRYPRQLAVHRLQRRPQRARLLGPREALASAAGMLQQGVADQLHEQREADHLLVGGAPVVGEDAGQERLLEFVIQQPISRLGQGQARQRLPCKATHDSCPSHG